MARAHPAEVRAAALEPPIGVSASRVSEYVFAKTGRRPTRNTVGKWRKDAGMARPRGSRVSRGHGAATRRAVVEMLQEGYRSAEVVESMAAEGVSVSPSTVRRWGQEAGVVRSRGNGKCVMTPEERTRIRTSYAKHGNAAKTALRFGVPISTVKSIAATKCTRRKGEIPEQIKASARTMFAGGASIRQVGNALNISHGSAWRIRHGLT